LWYKKYIIYGGENKIMDIMKLAIDEARKTMNENKGGPFGAAITDKEGNIISVASNLVLESHDPTAHAEIMAIRNASQKLKTHDLSGCILYATGYPCPMCLSAIIWANINEVYYATDLKDAENIGFRDDYIYNYIKGENNEILTLKQMDREKAIKLFEEYEEKNKTIY
jgi:guanine deaminase